MIQILIVEDERPISNLIRLSLTKVGYLCTCVYDGAEAADLLESRRFDLILLDVMLPEIDGFALMEYIRPLGIPVIFLTAKNAVTDRVQGLELGAEDYLVKPFEIIELLVPGNDNVLKTVLALCWFVLSIGLSLSVRRRWIAPIKSKMPRKPA